MSLTRNQQRMIARHPHLKFDGTGGVVERKPPPLKVTLPICTHRGELKKKGGCGGGCKVWECAIHSLCSSAPRAGIVQCPCDKYQAPV